MDWQIIAIVVLLMLTAGMFVFNKPEPKLAAVHPLAVPPTVAREPALVEDAVGNQEELARYMQGLLNEDELPAAREQAEAYNAPSLAAAPTMLATSVAAAFLPVLKLKFAVP